MTTRSGTRVPVCYDDYTTSRRFVKPIFSTKATGHVRWEQRNTRAGYTPTHIWYTAQMSNK